MRFLVALAVAAALAAPGWAAHWIELTAANSGNVSYLDLESVVPLTRSGTTQAWIKIVHKDGTTVKAKPVWFTMMRVSFDCGAKTYKVMSLIAYGRDGKVLDSDEGYLPPRPVVPETTSETWLHGACYASWRLRDIDSSPNIQ